MALTKIPTHMLFSGAASEDLSIDSDTLFIDSSANRVGIANNSPSVALDVTGSLTVSGTITGADLEIDSGTFSIDSSNNRVGIGTASPADLLDISANGTSAMRLSDSSSPATYAKFTQANGVLTFGADVGNAVAGSNIQFEVDGSEAMRINSSGNVGIGETSPAPRLHVTDSDSSTDLTDANNIASFERAGNARVVIATNTGNTGSLEFGDSGGARQGRVSYAHSDDSLALFTAGSERARLDSSGNVGIGTTSPTGITNGKILHLYNSSTASGAHSQITLSGGNGHVDLLLASGDSTSGGDPVISSTQSHAIRFGTSTNNTFSGFGEKMRIDSSGNVGIGTTSPNEALEVVGNIRLGDGGARSIIGPTNESLKILANPNATNEGIIFSTDGGTTTEMFIKDGGNVGIGETTPAVPLHISKDTSSGENIALLLDNNDTTAGSEIGMLFRSRVGTTNTDFQISAIANAANDMDLTFASDGGTERMRIDSSGNVMIGATSTSYKLYVNGTFHTSAKIGILGAPPASDIAVQTGTNTSGDYWRFGGNSGNTVGYFINNENDGVQISYGGSSWSSHSDERIKENIVSLGNVLPEIDNFRCVKYNRKGKSDTKIGFIAQDWEASSFSEVVDEDTGFVIESDGSVVSAKNSESTDSTKMMSYTETIPVLLKAIQELKAENDSLKSRVTALESS